VWRDVFRRIACGSFFGGFSIAAEVALPILVEQEVVQAPQNLIKFSPMQKSANSGKRIAAR